MTHLSQPLSLKKNFSWAFASNAVYTGCMWVLLSVMTKLTDAEKVGDYILAVAIINPVWMLTNLQMRPVIGSDVRHEYRFGDYYGLRLIGSAVLIGICLVIALGMNRGMAFFVMMGAVVCYKASDSLFDISYGMLQRHERLDIMAWSMFFRSIAGMVVFCIIIYLTRSIAWSFFGLAALWCWQFFGRDLAVARRFEDTAARFDRAILHRIAWSALPLGITMAVGTFNVSIPRYCLETYAGGKELGYYGALAYITMLIQMAVQSISPSAMPRLSRHYSQGEYKAYLILLAKMCLMAAGLGVAGVAGAYWLGEWFLRVAYTPEYAAYNKEFVWIVASSGIYGIASMLGVGMTATRKFKVQVPMALIQTVGLGAASLWLIPQWGMMGAAWTMCAGGALQCVVSLLIVLSLTRNKGELHG